MSKSEKERLNLRIVELRDKYDLKFKPIGIRLGISEAQAHSVYKRMKEKGGKNDAKPDNA